MTTSQRFRRQLLLLSGLLCLALPHSGRAQQQSDLVSWNYVSAQWQPDSSRWGLELAPNYVAYENLKRTFLRVGFGRVSYAWPRQQLTLSLLYEAGTADRRGTLQLARLYVGQALTAPAWHPRWQLSLDRLWFTPGFYKEQERRPTYRVRTLVGLAPHLSPRLSLVLTTEPFVYNTDFWLRHVRSQIGWQYDPTARIRAQVLYWNWWTGYEPRRVRWQHTVLLTCSLRLSAVP